MLSSVSQRNSWRGARPSALSRANSPSRSCVDTVVVTRNPMAANTRAAMDPSPRIPMTAEPQRIAGEVGLEARTLDDDGCRDRRCGGDAGDAARRSRPRWPATTRTSARGSRRRQTGRGPARARRPAAAASPGGWDGKPSTSPRSRSVTGMPKMLASSVSPTRAPVRSRKTGFASAAISGARDAAEGEPPRRAREGARAGDDELARLGRLVGDAAAALVDGPGLRLRCPRAACRSRHRRPGRGWSPAREP